jgi:hypothetical protein
MKQIIILVACIYCFQLCSAQNPIVIENQQAGNPISSGVYLISETTALRALAQT